MCVCVRGCGCVCVGVGMVVCFVCVGGLVCFCRRVPLFSTKMCGRTKYV